MSELRPDAKVLEELVLVGSDVLSRPATAFQYRMHMPRLRGEVEHALRRPAPDGRLIDDLSAMLVTALAHLAGSGPAPRWTALAEFLLPHVREDWHRALECAMRPTP